MTPDKSIEESEVNNWDGVKFYNWLHEEGYSFSDARYRVYLGGKNYWVWEVYKKYKGLPIEENEEDELWKEFIDIIQTGAMTWEELSKQYHLIKK